MPPPEYAPRRSGRVIKSRPVVRSEQWAAGIVRTAGVATWIAGYPGSWYLLKLIYNTREDNILLQSIAGCLNNLRETFNNVPQKKKLNQLRYVEQVWLNFITREDIHLPWQKSDAAAMNAFTVGMAGKTAAATLKAMIDHLTYALAGKDTRAESYKITAPVYKLMHTCIKDWEWVQQTQDQSVNEDAADQEEDSSEASGTEEADDDPMTDEPNAQDATLDATAVTKAKDGNAAVEHKTALQSPMDHADSEALKRKRNTPQKGTEDKDLWEWWKYNQQRIADSLTAAEDRETYDELQSARKGVVLSDPDLRAVLQGYYDRLQHPSTPAAGDDSTGPRLRESQTHGGGTPELVPEVSLPGTPHDHDAETGSPLSSQGNAPSGMDVGDDTDLPDTTVDGLINYVNSTHSYTGGIATVGLQNYERKLETVEAWDAVIVKAGLPSPRRSDRSASMNIKIMAVYAIRHAEIDGGELADTLFTLQPLLDAWTPSSPPTLNTAMFRPLIDLQ
eukprot:SAG31_NODE_3076_length_4709_cov_2.785033_3_plen_504_part_00